MELLLTVLTCCLAVVVFANLSNTVPTYPFQLKWYMITSIFQCLVDNALFSVSCFSHFYVLRFPMYITLYVVGSIIIQKRLINSEIR